MSAVPSSPNADSLVENPRDSISDTSLFFKSGGLLPRQRRTQRHWWHTNQSRSLYDLSFTNSIYLSFCQNEKGTSFFSFSDDVVAFVIVFLSGWEANRTSAQVEVYDRRNRTLCVFKWMRMTSKMSFSAINAVVKIRRVALLIRKKSCVYWETSCIQHSTARDTVWYHLWLNYNV